MTKILEFTTIHNALTICFGQAAGRLQESDNAIITWLHPTRKFLQWCQGTQSAGDERVDALEVYKTYATDIRDGTEIPGLLKLTTLPSLRALLKVTDSLDISTFKLERILRNGLSKAIDGALCRGNSSRCTSPDSPVERVRKPAPKSRYHGARPRYKYTPRILKVQPPSPTTYQVRSSALKMLSTPGWSRLVRC